MLFRSACKLPNKITLTRGQIERLAVFLALQENIEYVTIEETFGSGIGASHKATYHSAKLERDWQEDITDISDW